MAFIYRIVNKVNGKSYIGKTESTVEKRFKQHLAEYKKERCKDRPLYRAFLKYGTENFTVETLEETENAVEREIYWIEFYDTFSKGYNATKGGDGKPYIDEEIVLNVLFENSLNCNQAAKKLQINYETVVKIAKRYGFYNKVLPSEVKRSNIVLTPELVSEIKRLYVPKHFGKRKIAKFLNLSLGAVDGVLYSGAWKDVVTSE